MKFENVLIDMFKISNEKYIIDQVFIIRNIKNYNEIKQKI